MSQVTLYLDDTATAVLQRGVARSGKSKSRFLADLLLASEAHVADVAHEQALDAVIGAWSDAPPESLPDWATIRSPSDKPFESADMSWMAQA
jgi:hypothetical protein